MHKFLPFIFVVFFSSSNIFAVNRSLNVYPPDFELNILHINDHHSHLESNPWAKLILDGEKTQVEMGGFPRLVAQIKALEKQYKHVVKIHAGDAISGTAYYSLFKGEADAALMNQVCFDIFALGNHEFDQSDSGLKIFLDFLNLGNCQTSVLAANIIPQQGTPLSPSSTDKDKYFKPYVIKYFEQQAVVFIGIDIKGKTEQSSRPLKSTQFLDELATAQNYIDQLTRQGINKIVLVTHYQFHNDIKLARKLRGVDIIIGGDSHTLLGNYSQFGLNSAGPYPKLVRTRSGELICIAQAWQYSNLVGELNVSFNADGKLTSCKGQPHLLLGDSFKQKNTAGNFTELKGEKRAKLLNWIKSEQQLAIIQEDPQASKILAVYKKQISQMKQTRIAQVEEKLCMERIPGQGISELCHADETKRHGGDIQQLVSQSMWQRVAQADISILNAGAIRSDISDGPLNMDTVYQLMPFSNTLVLLQLSGQEIINTLEDALEFSLNPDFSSGAFPYGSGIQWDIELDNPKGKRFTNIRIKSRDNLNWSMLETDKTYHLVTNSYLASGRDGYTTLGQVTNSGRAEDTYISDAQAFIDYVREDLNGKIKKLDSGQYSTQLIK